MALSDLSFKLWDDASCTVPYSGLTQVKNKTDLSDNPQDFVKYLASDITSPTPATILYAASNPGIDNITLTPTDSVPKWAVATAYTLGKMVEPTSANTYIYRCTTAGTSHATVEPTWPTGGIGSIISDGTVVWTLVGKKHPTTEIKLALSSGALGAATGGAALNVATSIGSGVANKIAIYFRVTNTVVTTQDDTGYANISININDVDEVEA